MSENKTSLSYKDAGVDIDAGNQLVERIKSVTKKTHRPEVKGNLGGFAASTASAQTPLMWSKDVRTFPNPAASLQIRMVENTTSQFST